MEIKGKTFYILPSMMMVEKELENFDNEFNFGKKKKPLQTNSKIAIVFLLKKNVQMH